MSSNCLPQSYTSWGWERRIRKWSLVSQCVIPCCAWGNGATLPRSPRFSIWTPPKLLLSPSFSPRITLLSDFSTFWCPPSLGYFTVPTEKEALVDLPSTQSLLTVRKGEVPIFGACQRGRGVSGGGSGWGTGRRNSVLAEGFGEIKLLPLQGASVFL